MLVLLRRRRAAVLAGAVFRDGCAEVCAAGCRADAHDDRVRTRALAYRGPLIAPFPSTTSIRGAPS